MSIFDIIYIILHINSIFKKYKQKYNILDINIIGIGYIIQYIFIIDCICITCKKILNKDDNMFKQ